MLPGNRSDKDALLQTSVSAEFNKPLTTDVISGGVECIGPGKITEPPRNKLSQTDIPATCFPHQPSQECTEVLCKMEHGRTQTVLIDESLFCYKDNSLFTPLSGPFALINARWPDETWEQHASFSPSGFPGLIREDPFRIFLGSPFFPRTRCHLL